MFLQPIAAPSILGLFGFAGATFTVAAHLAGWYGGPTSGEFLFPFAAAFGGVAQFAAAMSAFRARDGLATALHGMWGSFWIAYGILNLLAAVGVFILPTGTFPEVHYLTGISTWATVAGWVLIASAILAVYTAGALRIAASWGRTVLPLGEYRKAANVPGRRPMHPIQYELGEPGVKQGQ